MPAALDTESIIQQVVKEKREKEEREARQNNNVLVGGGGGGGPASNRGANPPRVSGSPAPAMDKDTYKRLWAQQNSQVERGKLQYTHLVQLCLCIPCILIIYSLVNMDCLFLYLQEYFSLAVPICQSFVYFSDCVPLKFNHDT